MSNDKVIAKFMDLRLTSTELQFGSRLFAPSLRDAMNRDGGPIAGAEAKIENYGGIISDPYLIITGDGWSVTRQLKQHARGKGYARAQGAKFAAQFNAAANAISSRS